MSSRQARTERRAAERKARKLQMKQDASSAKAECDSTSPQPEPSREHAVSQVGFVSQPKPNRAEINRANAQFSTGPRSDEGKLASSRNSLRHGLASGTLIIAGEDPAEFEALKTALFEEHQPPTETEVLLVTEMAQSWWLAQRAIRLQNECFSADAADLAKHLSLFLRYQTTHERAFHKALAALLKLKQNRVPEQAVSPIGFVSQNGAALLDEYKFVSQSAPEPSRAPEQALSQIRFVSQNPPIDPQTLLRAA